MTSDRTTRVDEPVGDDGQDTTGSAERPGTIVRSSRRRWMVVGLIAGVAAIAVVLWWFEPQALFIDDVVDEAFPVADGAGTQPDPADGEIADDRAADDDPAEGEAAEGEVAEGEVADDDPAGGDTDEPTREADDAADASAGTADTDTSSSDTSTDAGPAEPVALLTGEFGSRNRYEVTGTATVFELDDTERILRLEDFASTNGPDLFVYLTAADASADDAEFDTDFVDLGVLTGNIGNQNYVIPADVDLEVHDTVVIWCRRFTSSFGVADLAATAG